MNSRTDPILTSVKDGVRTIKFNRPQKKNAMTPKMYQEVATILNEDALNDTIVVTIITGVGDYYTSGNDINVFDDTPIIEKSIKDFISAFIDHPKLIIAVVNGPAIGIGVTMLGLCDVVYASERATFLTPFIDLGLCPEGCSSYNFPRILGKSKANEMLLLGHTMTAREAYDFGFISEVIPYENLDKLFVKLHGYNKINVNSLKRAKQLINTSSLKATLHEINDRELKTIRECFHSDEFAEALSNKLSKMSSKL